MKKMIIALTVLISGATYAGCNPCVCGPGGGFDGNLGEWWERNCGRPKPIKNPKAVLCYNKDEDQIQKVVDLELALESEEFTACSALK